MKRKNPPRLNTEELRLPPPPPLPPRGTALFEAPEDDPGEQALEEIRAQFGAGDCQLKVFKIEDGVEYYCHTFTSPKELNEEAIKKLKRGGGRYNVKAIINGVFRYVIPFAILDDLPGHVASNGNGSTTSDAVLAMLQKQNELLMTAIIKRPDIAGEREPVSQLVDAVAKMQAMNKPPELSIDTIMKCIELGKSLGGGGSDDSLTGMVKEVVKGAAPAIAGMLAQRGGVPDQPMRTVSGVPASVEGQDMNVIEQAMLKAGIEFLKKKAIQGSDPELYVHLIADNEDDPKFQKLITRIINEDFSAFVSIDAELGKEPFAKFFKHVYDRLRSIYTQSNPVAEDQRGETWNDGNAPGDANTRSGSAKK